MEYIGGKRASRAEIPVDGRERVKQPSAGVDERRSTQALAARCAGNPRRTEAPIRGWEKALIRQFFFLKKNDDVPAPRRHMRLIYSQRGFAELFV